MSDSRPLQSTGAVKYWAIVPAAGSGSRMRQAGTDRENIPKQYLRINRKTVLELTLQRLNEIEKLAEIILVLGEGDDYWPALALSLRRPLRTVTGGAERVNSVDNALQALAGIAGEDDWVLVHDAVRPCVLASDIERLISTLEDDPVGGLLAAPVSETMKKVTPELIVDRTVPREQYWLAGTPQMFRYGILRQSIARAIAGNQAVTDEANAVELSGHRVNVVKGSAGNIKITHPEDLALAEQILGSQARAQKHARVRP